MRITALLVGVFALLLGGLWLLQGLGLAHVRPILCFADCAPIQEPSPRWAAIGLLVFVVGLSAILFSRKRRHRT